MINYPVSAKLAVTTLQVREAASEFARCSEIPPHRCVSSMKMDILMAMDALNSVLMVIDERTTSAARQAPVARTQAMIVDTADWNDL